MYDTLRDIRIAFRSLLKRRLFLATATATLALGLGASTAVFSVVESALFQPLPFHEADRLAIVWGVAGPERDIRGASPIEIRDWDQGVDALGPLAYYNGTTLSLGGEGGAVQLNAETVEPGYFGILGVSPILGRPLAPEDDLPGAAGSALISYELWQERFGGATDVLGRALRLDDVEFAVVGVLPQGFRGLSFQADVWTPLGPFVGPSTFTDRGSRYLAAVGRLAPGTTEQQAREQLRAVAARLEEAHPVANRERDAGLFPLRQFYVQGPARSLLLMVLGGVGLLLLIAAANVANLQLVRGIERRREIAVRYSLGAGRGPVARQLVTESVVLALIGGVAGLLVAAAGMAALLPLVPAGVLPPYASPGIDGPVLAFGLATALVVGVVFGLVPAARSSRTDPAGALRDGSRGATRGGTRGGGVGGQRAIIVAEVALALVLLVTAGLAIDSLQRQLALEPGFDAEGVFVARVALTGQEYDDEARTSFADGLLRELRGLPGVESAAVIRSAPMRGRNAASYIYRATDPMDADHRIRFYYHPVTPGYFETMAVPLVEGRGFTGADRRDAPGVVVVSQAFSDKVWPGESAVGKRVTFGSDTAAVVGVAGNVRQRNLTTDLMDPGEDPDVYFSLDQVTPGSFDILLRTAGDPGTLTGAVRQAVAERDPSVVLFDISTMASELAAQTALGRMVSSLLTVFAVMALLVTAVGLYGVLAFVVRGRRRELAIRAALGARPSAILRLVVRQGLGLVSIGVVIGLIGALAAGRLVAGLLFGVEPADPAILALTAGALVTVAALASYLPARQATRIDPRTALAEE
ncbi:MAG: ABC transporter permease [Candidatus Longimicrobiales bacterium M2_2A_002]